MMEDTLALPEKRTEILYCRVSPTNKSFISKAAKTRDVSESTLVEHILTIFRENHASKKRPVKKHNP